MKEQPTEKLVTRTKITALDGIPANEATSTMRDSSPGLTIEQAAIDRAKAFLDGRWHRVTVLCYRDDEVYGPITVTKKTTYHVEGLRGEGSNT